jgi:hypothetical protein
MAKAATTPDETSGQPACTELQRIASDFHALMTAHCPLCNGVGPQCIVETMQEALGNASTDHDGPGPMDLAQ